MKTNFITSKIAIDKNDSCTSVFDAEADFNQIVLRIRKGDKFVNFRVTNLGDTVTCEFWDKTCLDYDICLRNEPLHAKAFQTLVDNFLS